MVHVVTGSPICRGYRETIKRSAKGNEEIKQYRETNRQLAKENGEYKQLVGDLLKRDTQQREEIHKGNLRNIENNARIRELERENNALRQKCNSIAKILESPEETFTITGRPNEEQSIILPITQASDIEECDTQVPIQNGLDAISEHGDEEDQDDSLEPTDVTSMPPLNQGGPTPEQATLSIWRCLDDTNTPNSEKDKDMFHSTPKKPVLISADSRVNMSPLTRDPEQERVISILQHNQQQQQQQQEQPQQQLQEEVKEMETEKEVKKAKRKLKQKEEAAKRPRTYNLRKRN